MKNIIILAVVLLVALYCIIAEVIWKLRNRIFRRRLVTGVLIVALLASQTDIMSLFMKTDAETAYAAEAENSEIITVSAFAGLPNDIIEKTVPIGTELSELVLPDTLAAVCVKTDSNTEPDTDENIEEQSHEGNDTEIKTLEADSPEGEADSDTSGASQETTIIENITWQSEPEYDGDVEGEYIFTAVLPEGYVLTNGAITPQITVTVGGTDNIALLSGDGIMPIAETHATHDGIATAWTNPTSLPTTAGSYYLDTDVTLSMRWQPSANITLCLNGHTIEYNNSFPAIDVKSGGILDIYDCKGSGTVTNSSDCTLQINDGGTANIYGGEFISNGIAPAIQNGKGGTLTMSGGEITYANGRDGIDNSGDAHVKNVKIKQAGSNNGDGDGIYCRGGGTITVEDCEIESGTGVCVDVYYGTAKIIGGTFNGGYGIYSDDTIELSGSPTISSSTADIYLLSNRKITVTGSLSNTTPYSVRTQTKPTEGNPVVFTDSSTTSYNDETKFKAAEDGYIVRKNSSGQLELVKPAVHTHNGITFEPWTSTTSLPDTAGSYYLYDDVTLNDQCLLSKNTTLNLCLDGHTITSLLENPSFAVWSSNTLNIYDCQGNGMVKGGDTNCIIIESGGTANIYGGTFESTATGYATIYAKSDSSTGSSLKITGGTVQSKGSYMAIEVDAGSTAIITGGKFISNSNNVVQNRGTIEMSGGTVTGTSTGNRGAVGIANAGIATIKNVTITTEGTATDDTKADKGLYNTNGGTMTVENCNVTSTNRAVWNTGTDGSTTIKISSGTFNGSYGMYNDSGTFELSGSPTFTGSIADIYLSSGQTITVTGTLGNTAPYSVLTQTNPTADSPVVITDSSTTSYNDAAKFTAADSRYAVSKNSSGQLELAVPAHEHNGITFTAWTSTTSLPDSGSYYLENDVTLSVWLDTSANLTLCLNGHTITYDGLPIRVQSGGTLGIYDCQGKGAVVTDKSYCIRIFSGGTANIYGGIFNITDYPAIYVEGTVTIENASVSGSNAVSIQRGGTANIYGGTFVSTSNPTISAVAGASLKITDGTFIRDNGGGVIQNQGTLEMSGGTVIGKSTDDRGSAGIVNAGTATIKNVTVITEGTVADDDTKADKGLRNDNSGTMTVENCDITSSNWAVWNTGGSTIQISGGTFNGRYGIYNNNGTFDLSGSPTFAGSTADIYLSNNQKITVTGNLGNAAPYTVLTQTNPAVGSPVVITDSSNTSYNNADKFTPANNSYILRKNSSSQLELAMLATYTISYNAGSYGSGSVSPGTKTEGADYVLSSDTFTRTGYTQTGWSKNSNGSAKDYALGEIYTDDASITLYPYWTANQYTVTLKYQDGRTDDKKITVTYGSTYGSDLPSEPSRAGYHFVGWFTQEEGGDKVDSNSTVTTEQDHTLFGQWKDDINPVIGELTYNYTPKIVNGWLVGKDQLVITVPVTEEGSGVSEITYTVTPDDGTAETKTAPLTATEDAAVKKATITVNVDFKGTIKIDCTDAAGNPADSVTVGAKLSGAAGFAGIIIEDNAPTVSFVINGSAVSGETDYYDVAPDVTVNVTDDMNNAISGGIASVTYQVNGAAKTVNGDFEAGIVPHYSFTIPADKIPTGVNDITVKVEDNAGNTAEARLTVRVEGPEATPAAQIDYILENLTGLVAGAEYTVNEVTKTADADGTIPIEEDWIGADISIIKKGNKEGTTFDSEAQLLSIPPRPDAPSGFTANNAAYPGAEDGSVTGLDAGYTYEISDDGGITWKDAQWNGTDIIGLPAGSYRIRIKAAVDKNFQSAASETFTIGEDRLRQEDTPNASVDKENVTLKGLEKNAEYTITYTDENGTEHTDSRKSDENGNISIEDDWLDKTVDIVKKGNGTTTTDSDKQAVRIPAKEKKPAPKTTKVSAKGKSDGKITNLEPNETYEISNDGGKTWETKTADSKGEISGLPAGDYKIRTKAKDDADGGTFCSDAADCKIGTKSSSKGSGGSSGSGGTDNSGSQPDDDGGNGQTDNTPPGTVPPLTDTKNPERKTPPTDTPKTEELGEPEQGTKPDTKPSGETADQTAPTETENDAAAITGDSIATGTIKAAQDTTTTLTVGEGSVSVTVASDEYRYAAGVADTVAVANAVLTPEQIGLVNNGEKIEVRVEVKDISEQVSKEDKDIIENGLAAENRELTLGAYIDISMFIKIGDGDWNAITQSGEAIDVVIGIPDELQSGGRTFYIARCHEGQYALLNDMDTEAETITIQTALFSTYAIVYSQAGAAGSKCNLCHICPTFLGICCFVWLAIITAAVIVVMLIVSRRRKKEI